MKFTDIFWIVEIFLRCVTATCLFYGHREWTPSSKFHQHELLFNTDIYILPSRFLTKLNGITIFVNVVETQFVSTWQLPANKKKRSTNETTGVLPCVVCTDFPLRCWSLLFYQTDLKCSVTGNQFFELCIKYFNLYNNMWIQDQYNIWVQKFACLMSFWEVIL